MSNENRVITEMWSNADSEALYRNEWPDEPAIRAQKMEGDQCGGCSFFAPCNADYGLCCHPTSRHFTETVFEHFTCPVFENEGWGAHSFGHRDLLAELDRDDT